VIDIQFVRNVKHGFTATLSNRRLAEVYIWQLSGRRPKSTEILRRRFERMDDSAWSDAKRQELRINPDIRAPIHYNGAGKQTLLQKLTFRAIGVRFEYTICKAIGRKGVFIGFVSDPTKNGSSPHQRRFITTVKNEAHRDGK
jgi:hypothetical protein